jgi:hypothetical protein
MKMPETSRERIRKKALELLESQPSGMRYSEIVRQIHEALSENPNTIAGNVYNLDTLFPDKVYKPARGVFKATKFRESEAPLNVQGTDLGGAITREKDFYEAFADWITKELEECTKAIPLGGNRFKDKWGRSSPPRSRSTELA